MEPFIPVMIAFVMIIADSAAITFPPPEGDRLCASYCRPVKPQCPIGEALTRYEGCWSCCQPLHVNSTQLVVHLTSHYPIKASGEIVANLTVQQDGRYLE